MSASLVAAEGAKTTLPIPPVGVALLAIAVFGLLALAGFGLLLLVTFAFRSVGNRH